MSRLTTTAGALLGFYRSGARKKELVDRLGTIEHLSGPLAEQICERYCRYPGKLRHHDQLEKQCQKCPLTELMELIGGV